MNNVVGQIVSALDATNRIRLLALSFDGAIIRFITSEEGGSAFVARKIDTTNDWFEKHGLGEVQGDQQG